MIFTCRACGVPFSGRPRCFVVEIEAARAYDMAAIEHFGEFAKTNFQRSKYV